MAIYIASIIRDDPDNGGAQVIPPGVYTLLRFPFGAESYDAHGMHDLSQPDGYQIPAADWDSYQRSGLIWPKVDGWGTLELNIHWESGDYTELRDVFTRDPLGLGSDPDNRTAYDHRPPTIGMQCFTKYHGLFVHPDVPLGVRVYHNDTVDRRVIHAQLKLTIETDVQPPPA